LKLSIALMNFQRWHISWSVANFETDVLVWKTQ
jgi:hypothetical protein